MIYNVIFKNLFLFNICLDWVLGFFNDFYFVCLKRGVDWIFKFYNLISL